VGVTARSREPPEGAQRQLGPWRKTAPIRGQLDGGWFRLAIEDSCVGSVYQSGNRRRRLRQK